MTTTIQVSEFTRQRLGLLKEQFKAASYDEVLDRILKEKFKPKSMFGSCKGIGSWKKEYRMRSKYD